MELGAGSTLFSSASPALALGLGFIFIILGVLFQNMDLYESGWGFVTIGMIVEVALPVARRLR